MTVKEKEGHRLVVGIYGDPQDLRRWVVRFEREPKSPISELTREEIRDLNANVPIKEVMPLSIDGVQAIDLSLVSKRFVTNFGYLEPRKVIDAVIEKIKSKENIDWKNWLKEKVNPLHNSFQKVFSEYENPIVKKLEKDNIMWGSDINIENGKRVYTLETVVPLYDSKAKENAEKHGVELSYQSIPWEQGKLNITPVYRIKCSEGKIGESAKKLLVAEKGLEETLDALESMHL